jgi:hypothetical protein
MHVATITGTLPVPLQSRSAVVTDVTPTEEPYKKPQGVPGAFSFPVLREAYQLNCVRSAYWAVSSPFTGTSLSPCV